MGSLLLPPLPSACLTAKKRLFFPSPSEKLLRPGLCPPTLRVFSFVVPARALCSPPLSPRVVPAPPLRRYTSTIDVWSAGCIAAELFLGVPIFPGETDYQQLWRIHEMLGTPPDPVLRCAAPPHTHTQRLFGPLRGHSYGWW